MKLRIKVSPSDINVAKYVLLHQLCSDDFKFLFTILADTEDLKDKLLPRIGANGHAYWAYEFHFGISMGSGITGTSASIVWEKDVSHRHCSVNFSSYIFMVYRITLKYLRVKSISK